MSFTEFEQRFSVDLLQLWRLIINGKTITITRMSKGAGMMRPNMATMLGFVATDAGIAEPLLRQLVCEAADESFNCITVDGDTSTNDGFMLIASAAAGTPEIASFSKRRSSDNDDWVPSICEDSTASLRT